MPVEEQTVYGTWQVISAALPSYHGQRLIIPNRQVTHLAFYTLKHGNPSGDLTFLIKKVSNDDTILSKVWGNASGLPTELAWVEAEFATPATINEEVRILLYFPSGNASNGVAGSYASTDVKASEVQTDNFGGSWRDRSDYDCCYKYTYGEPPSPAGGGGPAALIAAGII